MSDRLKHMASVVSSESLGVVPEHAGNIILASIMLEEQWHEDDCKKDREKASLLVVHAADSTSRWVSQCTNRSFSMPFRDGTVRSIWPSRSLMMNAPCVVSAPQRWAVHSIECPCRDRPQMQLPDSHPISSLPLAAQKHARVLEPGSSFQEANSFTSFRFSKPVLSKCPCLHSPVKKKTRLL